MKSHVRMVLGAGLLVSVLLSSPAADRFVSLSGGHVPPFTSWATAATNIQAAIDAAAIGDTVWVTNGVYSTGGKVKAGDLTNRVALDKTILLQSVNGPTTTIIQGAWDPVGTNGPLAVRCAWLTNGATLSGFTLQGGATRNSGGILLQSGGGVWSASSSAQITNCWVIANRAQQFGGGAYDGNLVSCVLSNNVATPNGGKGGGAANSILTNCWVADNLAGTGGGTYGGVLYNSAVIRNTATFGGGGCDQSQLNQCTVTRNSTGTADGGGIRWIGGGSVVRNCIVWNNTGAFFSQNYTVGLQMSYSCSSPLPTGTGNISTDPQLLGDAVHLAATSPCRDTGTSLYATGTDIDGQSWAVSPSMGCDQWSPQPLVVVPPVVRAAVRNGQVRLITESAGQPPFHFSWSKDGVLLADDAHYTNAQSTALLIRDFGVADGGAYRVVASNSFSVATSKVVQVTVHCVDAANTASAAPYTSWESAAATIQDAVDVAGPTGVVLVTNGVYSSGGRTKSGALTNRLVIDKPILITSVNGSVSTIIAGQWDPISTNGPSAVRCAWLGEGASLSGFTLRNGATTQNPFGFDGIGGGAFCSSTNAELVNCTITNCRAWMSGGGAYLGVLRNSSLVGNAVVSAMGVTSGGGAAASSTLINCLIFRNTSALGGGGVYGGWLYNCAVTENTSVASGGGVQNAQLINCTVTANTSTSFGGGVSGSILTNCIVYLNSAPTSPNVVFPVNSVFTCSTPLLTGAGNITNDPQLTDGSHLAITSPCRGMGISSAVIGTDLDGNPWATPPSIGCDEVDDNAFAGPLSVSVTAAYPEVAAYGGLPLTGLVSGRAARVEWSFGDGPVQTNLSALTFHTWTNPGDYLVTFTAYNADNPAGVSASTTVHVIPFQSPQITALGKSGTNFVMSFPGQAGITYVVEQTTNLAPVNWQTVQTLISTGSVIQVTDTRATNAMRFYRTRMQ